MQKELHSSNPARLIEDPPIRADVSGCQTHNLAVYFLTFNGLSITQTSLRANELMGTTPSNSSK